MNTRARLDKLERALPAPPATPDTDEAFDVPPETVDAILRYCFEEDRELAPDSTPSDYNEWLAREIAAAEQYERATRRG